LTTSPQLPSVVRFGAYEADLLSGELRKSGIRLKIQDRPFQILAILLEHPGLVVTREQIMREVWDTNWWGSTKTLDMHISWLRKKLGDDAASPRYITTVRGVGFRFERG